MTRRRGVWFEMQSTEHTEHAEHTEKKVTGGQRSRTQNVRSDPHPDLTSFFSSLCVLCVLCVLCANALARAASLRVDLRASRRHHAAATNRRAETRPTRVIDLLRPKRDPRRLTVGEVDP